MKRLAFAGVSACVQWYCAPAIGWMDVIFASDADCVSAFAYAISILHANVWGFSLYRAKYRLLEVKSDSVMGIGGARVVMPADVLLGRHERQRESKDVCEFKNSLSMCELRFFEMDGLTLHMLIRAVLSTVMLLLPAPHRGLSWSSPSVLTAIWGLLKSSSHFWFRLPILFDQRGY